MGLVWELGHAVLVLSAAQQEGLCRARTGTWDGVYPS